MFILHLSDLHFGTISNADNWSSQLSDDLKNELQCFKLDALILSGDIANRSTAREYEAAEKFLNLLIDEFQLQPEHIVIVPGNHDLNWALSKKAYTLKRQGEYKGPLDEDNSISLGQTVEIVNSSKYKQRFDLFREFYQKIKGTPYPIEYNEQAIINYFPELNLLILGLNSAWRLDHHYTSRASICPEALSRALTCIRRNPNIYKDCLKFAVWHHPINSPDEDRIKDSEFLQRLAQDGFCVALHGHIHKADNNLYRYDMDAGGRKLELLSAGTFGAPTRDWVPGYPLQYNLLRIQDERLVVETRCRREKNGAWKPDAIWTQGVGKDPVPRYEILLPKVVPFVVDQQPAGDINTNNGVATSSEKQENGDLSSDDEIIPMKKVLILAVCPKDTARLALEEEVREICNLLWRAQKVKFVVEVRWAVRVRDFSRALLEFEPEIVHFCGHGSKEYGILLEDDDGQAQSVSPEALAGIFDLFADTVECAIECVFLNLCYTTNQANSIAPFAKYMIGVEEAIPDKVAIAFSTYFYEALANGRSIDFAFKYACTNLKIMGVDGNSVPRLRVADRQVKKRNAPLANYKPWLKILFLAADPIDTSRLRLDEEAREILLVLSELTQQGQVIVQQRWGARFEDLHSALLDFRPQIVHFAGHGNQDGLVFEDKKGMAHIVGKESIAKLFGLFSDQVKCVLLNANYSNPIAAEICKSIDCAIGVDLSIDEQAITFAVGFYRSLAARNTYEEAYQAGCIEAEHQEISSSTIFSYSLHKKQKVD